MEKTEKIISGVSRVLSSYSDTGIFKSKLIEILEKEKICFRKTFYAYLKDNKFDGIFEERGPGEYKKIYPTEKTRNLTIFKHKLEKIDKLLDMIGNSDVGDVIWTEEHIAKCRNIEIEEIDWWLHRHSHFKQPIHVTEMRDALGKEGEKMNAFSLMARYDFLKNLPLFLSEKISEHTKNQTIELDQKYFTAIQPLVFKSLEILRQSYSRSSLCQDSLLIEMFKMSDAPRKIIDLHSVKGIATHNISANFLKILTRYYFVLSIVFSDSMIHESRNEQKTISRVIEEFYPKNESFDQHDKVLSWDNIETVVEEQKSLSDKTIDAYYNLVARSIAPYFIHDSNSITNNDPHFVRTYVLELFKRLDIFTDVELRWICYCDQKIRKKELAEVEAIKKEISVQKEIDEIIEKMNNSKSEQEKTKEAKKMFLKMLEQKRLHQDQKNNHDVLKEYEKNFDEKEFHKFPDVKDVLEIKD